MALLFGAIPGGPELLIVLLVGILFLLVPIGLAYWVYQDATGRGNDRATLWAIGVVIAGLVAPLVGAVAVLALYVLVGRT
ncbi:hypothetical protein [Candidatus Halobonum tyrrellensis]|uniref:Cardiolipin synthase N-terminal domain-containing protein n=1 Tax=Candidatus Halobonum tyrrellensis G22 TaxID=1324957 RepID=V4HE48_9EURY|nr:hypothetical protein [Candidatus Halobonum tyrrellensis]ESP88945.1 hypothetical protein K933_06663 [Candidatus Halobonum tyrrellensis G22]